jgi:molybdopterin synthase catalytic subunit
VITELKIVPEALLTGDLDPKSGAVVLFAGVVRADETDRRVVKIHYECYTEMAEKELAAIVEETTSGFDVRKITVLHRVGDVPAGEISLLVVVASGHRKAAFDASVSIVDEIKKRVPIWKKECYDNDTFRWL